MSMNEHLAAMFGTDKIASEQDPTTENFFKVASVLNIDLEKTASEDANGLFHAWALYEKTASENGIDLSQFSLQQVAGDFSKWASTHIYGNGGTDPTVEQAVNYVSKLAAETESYENIVKIGTDIGAVAAHAYLATLNQKLAADDAKQPGNSPAGFRGQLGGSAIDGEKSPDQVGRAGGRGYMVEPGNEAAHGKGTTSHGHRVGDHVPPSETRWTRTKRTADAYKMKAENAARKAMYGARHTFLDKENPNRNRNLGIAAGGVAGLAAAGYAGKKIYDRHKDNSEKRAFDELAARHALRELTEAGFDTKEAADRLFLALQQEALAPVSDSVKIASAEDPQLALLTRAYELMETAGYEIGLGTRRQPWR